MNGPDLCIDSELARDLQIEEICERYEEAWREGRFPEIAACLGEIDPAGVTTLKSELETREREWRERWGQIPPSGSDVDAESPKPESPAAGSNDDITEDYDGEVRVPVPSKAAGRLSIRCRQCHGPIEIPEQTPVWTVHCKACGSTMGRQSRESTAAGRPSDQEPLPPGEIGHFQLIVPLGHGGFGSVWLACDHHLDKLVAVKMPRPGRLSDEELKRFRGDARAAAQVRHPHVVAVHEVGQCRGLPYIVSDYIEGPSLAVWLKQRDSLSPKKAAELCKLIAIALQHVHQVGVIHRDLKPANILMDGNDEPHLVDFGLAKREAEDLTLTLEGYLMGTVAYMSPEQAALKPHTAGPASDVYSLGTILFEMLTGAVPFHGDKEAVLEQVRKHEPPRPRRLNQKIPIDLETICLKCLEKEPHRRFATAAELAEELDRYLTGRPILSRPIGLAGRAWRWCGRNRAVAALLATVAAVLVTGSIVSTYFAIHEAWARGEAEVARGEAEANFRDARGAVQDLLTTVSNSTLLNQPGLQPVRRQLLEQARDYYQRFRERTSAGEEVSFEDAEIAFRLAGINRELGDVDRAHLLYVEASAALAEIHSWNPKDPEVLDVYASALMGLGNSFHARTEWDEADALFAKAARLRQQLKEMLKTEAGQAWLQQQSPTIRERLQHVDQLIAMAIKNRGDVELDRWRSASGDARTMASWGRARTLIEESRGILVELAATATEDSHVRRDLAKAEYSLGRCYWVFHRSGLAREAPGARVLETAEQHLGHAVHHFETLFRLRDSQSETLDYFDYLEAQFHHASALRVWGDVLYSLVWVQQSLGWVQQSVETLEQAVNRHRRALEAFEQMAVDNPGIPLYRFETANTCLNLATALLAYERDNAREEVRRRLKDVERILDELDEQYSEDATLSKRSQHLRDLLHALQQKLTQPITGRQAENRTHDLSASNACGGDSPLGTILRRGDQHAQPPFYPKNRFL